MRPQVCGVQPQPPEEGDAAAEDEEPLEAFDALKTESCSAWRLLWHLGQAMVCLADMTIRS